MSSPWVVSSQSVQGTHVLTFIRNIVNWPVSISLCIILPSSLGYIIDHAQSWLLSHISVQWGLSLSGGANQGTEDFGRIKMLQYGAKTSVPKYIWLCNFSMIASSILEGWSKTGGKDQSILDNVNCIIIHSKPRDSIILWELLSLSLVSNVFPKH